jgi:HEPN domain-containing protein
MAESSPGRKMFAVMLDSAQQDLAVCRLLVGNGDISDAMVGFHAQQCVEKAIKAVLSAHGVEFRRTHDLINLLDLLDDNRVAAPPQSDWLDELNPYAVEARYGTIEPGDLDRLQALAAAEQVFEWATRETAKFGVG